MATKLVDDVQIANPCFVSVYGLDTGESRGAIQLTAEQALWQGVHIRYQMLWLFLLISSSYLVPESALDIIIAYL